MDNRITLQELQQLFGETMPVEAFQLLAEPPDVPLWDIRLRLMNIAAANNPRLKAKANLHNSILAWREEFDLPPGAALEIMREVVNGFDDEEPLK